MKLCVAGLGKLGSPLAAVLASKGHSVTGIDTDERIVAALREGRAPVAEPGLQGLIDNARPRLKATLSWDEAVEGSDASFIIVPTPSGTDGAFSNEHVLEAVARVGTSLRNAQSYHVVNITSTVMPGSCDGAIRAALERSSGLTVGKGVGLCYNPEFIALGTVIRDMLRPDMILLGQSDVRAGDVIEAIYSTVAENSPPIQRMNLVNAETAKIALNAYVTMRISFANFIAELCEKLPGGDSEAVLTALGKDSRIGGKYLKGAMGYGGPCFPRDNAAIANLAQRIGVKPELAIATDVVNRRQATRLAAKVRRQLTQEGRIAVLGLAYKPDTPVVEESQGVMLAAELARGGAAVMVHDPLALDSARKLLGDKVRYATGLEEAVTGARVIVITTPDPAYCALPAILEQRQMDTEVVIFDCWGLLAQTPTRARVIRLGAN